MNRLSKLLVVLVLVVFSIQASAKKSELSQQLYTPPESLNQEWEFYKGDQDIKDPSSISQWVGINLPHTPQLESKPVVNQWQGISWYRKKLSSEMKVKAAKVFIDFEAAMNISEIFINGKKIAEHKGGYLPFSVDVTDELGKSDTWLYVKLDNRDSSITGPKPLAELDFNTYGGIYRNVWLRRENSIYITDPVAANRVASGGIRLGFPQVSEQESKIDVYTHLNSLTKNTRVLIKQEIFLGDKKIASDSQVVKIPKNGEYPIAQHLTVKDARLWAPDHPALYKLVTRVYSNNQLVDQEETAVGIREMKFVNNQLFINGKQTYLRGVNRHQEYPYVGYAISDAAQYRDAEKIKRGGFDYVRLSHYPQSNAFMKAADELGLVLLDSILGWQYVNHSPEFTEQVLQTCRDMIRRDRNHPSVLAWECSLNESDMPNSLMDEFNRVVHQELPGENVYSAGWKNYAYDIYLQARQHRMEHYAEPNKPYIVSEYGDWEYYAMNAGFNQNKWSDLLQADRSSRQLLSDGERRLQQQLSNIAESHNDNFNTPAFADGYWVMFDYSRGYSPDLESSGVMSVERLPKFSYYFFQSQRDATEKVQGQAVGYQVYIASYWQKDSALRVPIFTNADVVKIYLNGKYLGDAAVDVKLNHLKHPIRYFQIQKYEAGILEARAFVKGVQVASHQITTPGEFTQIRLVLENSKLKPQSGTQDVVFVYAQLLDSKGNLIPTQHQKVRFKLEGDASLVSNAQTESEAGHAVAVLRLGADLASVRIQAESLGIVSPSVYLGDLPQLTNELQKAELMH